jgi:hypothetical protein
MLSTCQVTAQKLVKDTWAVAANVLTPAVQHVMLETCE